MQEQLKTHPQLTFRKPPTGSPGHQQQPIKSALPALILFLMSWVSVLPVKAQSIYYVSQASGNWPDATTWYFVNYSTGAFNLDAVPTTVGEIQVYGATVTLTGTGEYGSLTVVASGTLNINANSDMNVILEIENDGIINIGGNAIVAITSQTPEL